MSQAKKERAQTELKNLHEQWMARLKYFEVNGLREVRPDAANLMVTLAPSSASDLECTRNEIDYFLTRDLSNISNFEAKNMFAQEKLVILQGISGSGKTNLCHALLIEWQAGRLWENRYDFVFLINVQELTKSMIEGPFTIERALNVLYPDVFRHITFQDLLNFRHLIIVDSLDQCNVENFCPSRDRTIESVIKDLLTMETNCDRLVMGTPRSCQKVRQNVIKDPRVRYLDVQGFSEEQVMEYVIMFWQKDQRRAGFLWQLIKENRSMLGYARLPLFANIICNVLSANAIHTIETRTELFVWAYTVYQTRHLQKYRPLVDVSSHEKLFGNKILMETLTRLGKMASYNLSSGKTFFDSDEFFDQTEFESVLVTPLLHRRQRSLCFVHEFFIDFFAAIHLFVNRQELNDEIVGNPRSRGVLPILCGLLGAASENSNSHQIVWDFVKPLVKKFNINLITRHPLCSVSRALFETDKQFYLALCFEFQNSHLVNDADTHWDNHKVEVKQHFALDQILFFLRHLRQGRRPINDLAILPNDGTLTLTECLKLSESIVSYSRLHMLRLGNIEVNREMMRILAPAICMTLNVVFKSIRTTSKACWETLRKVMQDPQRRNTLRLKTLRLSKCDLDNEMKKNLSPVICLISNVCFESIHNTSEECWNVLRNGVQDSQNRNTLGLDTLVFEKCDLNTEMMENLSPVICLMSTVWFKSIDTTDAECWEILRRVMLSPERSDTIRLKTLGLNNCDLNRDMMNSLSPVICLIPTVWLESLRTASTASVECWERLDQAVQDAHNSQTLRLKELVLSKCHLNNEMMKKVAPVICLMSTVVFKSILTTNAVCWEILHRVVQDSRQSNTLSLDQLELHDCDLSNEMMNKLAPVICLISGVTFKSIRTANAECWEELHRVVQESRQNNTLRLDQLALHDCDMNNEMMKKLAPVICLMSTVVFKSIRTASVECWETLQRVVQDSRQNNTLSIELHDCDFNNEVMNRLSPVIRLM